MRKTALLFLFLFAQLSFAQKMKFNIDHYAINVIDLDKSVAFYQNIFSLKEIYNGTELEHIRWFRLGDQQELHIIQVDNLELKLVKGVHLALTTPDLDDFIKHLNKNDTPFSDWPGNSSKISTRPDKVKQVYIQDPDGYWIEINDGEKRFQKEKK